MKHCIWSIWFKQLEDGRVVFSINPSRFGSLEEFLHTLLVYLGAWALTAIIRRLDCTVTIPLPFQTLFMGMDFGSKHTVERYRDTSRGRTVYIGRDGRRFGLIIYDKWKQLLSKYGQQLDHPATRVERSSIPRKGMAVQDLHEVVCHQPFSFVTRNEITFHPPTTNSRKAWVRYGEFAMLVEREGFFMARKILTKKSNRNFLPQYGEFFTLEPVRPSLNTIFQQGMATFFGAHGGVGAPLGAPPEPRGGAPTPSSAHETTSN